jgi:hypothetical protein
MSHRVLQQSKEYLLNTVAQRAQALIRLCSRQHARDSDVNVFDGKWHIAKEVIHAGGIGVTRLPLNVTGISLPPGAWITKVTDWSFWMPTDPYQIPVVRTGAGASEHPHKIGQ